MAKVWGPCLSLDAHGSIGKSITYQKRPRGHAILKPPKTGQTKLENPTVDQQTIRDYMKEAVEKWHELTDDDRAEWNEYVSTVGET